VIAEIIATGNEIIRGRSIDTNSAYIARQLISLGHDVRCFSLYGDSLKDLTDGFTRALGRADLVIVTGGLGPTEDDLTRDAAAKVMRRPLVFDKTEWDRLRKLYAKFKRKVPRSVRRQAYFPKGATVMPNEVGSAAGFMLEKDRRRFVALPGPPREMTPMLDVVLADLYDGKKAAWYDKAFKICGVPESRVESLVFRPLSRIRGLEYGITAKGAIISLNLRARDPGAFDRVRDLLRRKVGVAYYGEDDDTIAKATAMALLHTGTTLAVAESCTGGRISDLLTDIPGISAVLVEDVVTYSNESKIKRLRVKPTTLRKFGAVSKETATEMAEGVLRTSGADIAISTTGIAGPDGGTKEKPVGLVFFGLAGARRTRTKRKIFRGTRLDVKERASDFALEWLREHLQERRK
jgi:nicotinamide-nucleotide amidase